MPRTFLTSLIPAAVIATAWLRLESPINQPLRSVAVAGLAVLPALVRPLAARVAAALLSTGIVVSIAYGVSPLHPRHLPGAIWSRFSGGFLDFYDVRTPFDPRVHAEMRSVLLTAVFGFALAVALAVAARRPVPAVLLLLAGAGWPATLRGPSGGLVVGGLILLGALAVLAGMTSRNVPRVVIPAAVGLALTALVVSTSSAVAKGGLVSWQRWDFYNAAQPPVSVSFVWSAQYAGIHFPRKRTPVLEVKAPRRSLYWRAAVLDNFVGDHWIEAPPLRGDALEPGGQKLLRQDVQVLALADTRLVGASVPLKYDAGDAPLVENVPGIAQLPSGLTRGFRYSVWSEAPQPTAAQLADSKPIYPVELVEPGTFLDVGRGITAAPFGQPRIVRPELERYAPLERAAESVAGKARTPYAAAAALVSWFRTKGGFVYTDRPPSSGPTAPLVDFVTRTRAGYCQHYAGAMALMLRYLGVPARVAVGFSSGVYDSKTAVWRVTDHDAHAWVEVWFRGYGWLPFDPTPAARPGRGQLSAPYAAAVEGGPLAGSAAGGRAVGAGPSDPRQAGHRHGETEGTGVKGAGGPALVRAPSSHGSLLLLLALLLGVAFTAIVVAKIGVRRGRYLTRDPRRLAAACRRELADYLVDQNIDAARSATLHELGSLVRHELAVEPDAFVAAATAARFGPPSGAERAAHEARRELRALTRAMRARMRTRDRLRGIVSLRSFGFAA
ncbi:MAG: protein-glutamine gamma-glutamyltransferase [Gaiellaceae bacterium]|nr:protein-glutamine gamma-glutamyltransferase [Gaiellaceae bacterium]